MRDAITFGDHHAYGHEGVRLYTRYQSIAQRRPNAVPVPAEFTMAVAR